MRRRPADKAAFCFSLTKEGRLHFAISRNILAQDPSQTNYTEFCYVQIEKRSFFNMQI